MKKIALIPSFLLMAIFCVDIWADDLGIRANKNGVATAETVDSAKSKPNIIFILADDQGWNGTSVQMHPKLTSSKSDYYQTPHIQKLAKTGVRFSQAYSPGPMCTPTRASLQTGKSPAQLRMTNVGRTRTSAPSQRLLLAQHSTELSTRETTIGEVLKRAGYATAWFGKWHLGGQQGPGAHGYDVHDGPTGNADGNTEDPSNPKDIFGVTRRGLEFMEKCNKKKQPFYLQLWHYAVHSPIENRQETLRSVQSRRTGRTHRSGPYAAMTQDFDTSIGMILEKLEELGIAESTYIVYMSDHGAGGRSPNTPLRDGKGTLWEGGIRVPLIISGPGVKEGTFCQEATAGWDLFPTFCEMAGVKESLPKGIEGTSLMPLIEKTSSSKFERKQDGVGHHFPHYRQGGGTPVSTWVMGNYKLVKLYETDQLQLFDLSKDIGESRDLSKSLPKKTAEMHQQLKKYLARIQAAVPIPNPNYDPNAAEETPRRGRGNKGGGKNKNGRGKGMKRQGKGKNRKGGGGQAG